MELSDLFTDLNMGHEELKRVVTTLVEEGFSVSGYMMGRNSVTLSMFHDSIGDAVFIKCDDLGNPDSGTIQRAAQDLEKSPPPVPLAAYQTPVYH